MTTDIASRIPALEEVERTLSTIPGLQVTLKQINPSTLRTADLPIAVMTFGRSTRESKNVQVSSFSQVAQLDVLVYLQSGASAMVVEEFVAKFAAKIDSIANEPGRPYVLELTEIDVGIDPAAKLPSVGFSITVIIQNGS